MRHFQLIWEGAAAIAPDLELEFTHLYRATKFRRFVSCKDYSVAFESRIKISQSHLTVFSYGGYELLKLWKVRMVADVTRINQCRFQVAPLVLIRPQFLAVEFIIEEATFAAHQVNVEIIGLQTVGHGCNFANPAVLEFEQADRSRVVFIGLEDLTLTSRPVADNLLDLTIHAHQECIQGVTARSQKAAASHIFFDIPTELTIPRTDPVKIIDLAIMQVTQ